MATRVLSFMAHPDDTEIMAAGTLIRLRREVGCAIVIATATSGDCGSAELSPDEISRIRHEEAKSAAAIIDAEYYCAGSSDLFIMYDEPTLKRFTEVIRKARPDVVITAPPSDYMIDHENVSHLVRMASFGAPAPNFRTHDVNPAPPIDKVPHLYYCDPVDLIDPYDGKMVEPGFVIDITGAMKTKERMLVCHASQREWLRKHHGIDEYVEIMKRMGAERGKFLGVTYGEGFRQHMGHPYPQNNIILELLDERA